MCDMTPFVCVTWLMHVFDMTYSCDACILGEEVRTLFTWLSKYVWHNSLICVTWLNYVCDMTHLCAWLMYSRRGGVQIVSRILVHMWDMTHSCVTWPMHSRREGMRIVSRILIHLFDMTHICDMTLTKPHSYGGHDSFMCDMNHVF